MFVAQIYKNKKMENTSKHPFEPFIPLGSTKLIIGTIPPQRFCLPTPVLNEQDVNFYYGSCDNSFWDLISSSFDVKFDKANTDNAILQRKNFLKSKQIGITDIVDICIHKDGLSSDDKLIEITFKNLKKLLSDNPQIDTLIYTSEYVKKFINRKFYEEIGKTFCHNFSNIDKKIQHIFIGEKKYTVMILHSPSPSGLRRLGTNGKEKRLQQYKTFLN